MNNEFVQSSKDILGGVPVFTGTRVPIQNMIDYLEAGDSIERSATAADDATKR